MLSAVGLGLALGFGGSRLSRDHSEASLAGDDGRRGERLTALQSAGPGGHAAAVIAGVAAERGRLQMFDGVTADDMARLFQEMIDGPRSNRSAGLQVSKWSLLLSRWAQLDPQGGLEILLAWDGAVEGGEANTSYRDRTVANFLAQWAAADPSAALAAAERLGEKSLRLLAYRNVMGAMAHSDPDTFFKIADSARRG